VSGGRPFFEADASGKSTYGALRNTLRRAPEPPPDEC
jgi:hypothetical protein